MPKQRTSLQEQISAVAALAGKNKNSVLQDAVHTLSQCQKIAEEAKDEAASGERIADLILDIIGRS